MYREKGKVKASSFSFSLRAARLKDVLSKDISFLSNYFYRLSSDKKSDTRQESVTFRHVSNNIIFFYLSLPVPFKGLDDFLSIRIYLFLFIIS